MNKIIKLLENILIELRITNLFLRTSNAKIHYNEYEWDRLEYPSCGETYREKTKPEYPRKVFEGTSQQIIRSDVEVVRKEQEREGA